MYRLLPLPIYITENGTCDRDDRCRCRYLFDHLQALCNCGLPAKRHYHRCFCDNFEWLEGESTRFGLVHVDYATQRRTVKRSGQFYAEMIRARGVTEAAYKAYVAPCAYSENGGRR